MTVTRQESNRRYREKHKDKIKKYRQTSPVYFKSHTIHNWKRIGVKYDDFDKLFDEYLKETHCWICDREFLKRNDKNLDHNHATGEPRYVCCRSCNNKLGK